MIVVKEETAEWAEQRVKVSKIVLKSSTFIWSVMENGRLAFVCGLNRQSLLGSAEFWMAPVVLKLSVLKRIREMLNELKRYAPKITVHTDSPRDQRFAEFFGFQFTGADEYDGKLWPRGEL